MEHNLKRVDEGSGILMKTTPTCSCGWTGIGYEEHNDHKYSNLRDQELEHLYKHADDLKELYYKYLYENFPIGNGDMLTALEEDERVYERFLHDEGLPNELELWL